MTRAIIVSGLRGRDFTGSIRLPNGSRTEAIDELGYPRDCSSDNASGIQYRLESVSFPRGPRLRSRPTRPNVKEILNEARVIIFRNKKSSISSHDAVFDIPRLQLKAGNVDDALAALAELTPGYADPFRIEIAEAMAQSRTEKRRRAGHASG